jgi:hypothetical protein
MPVMVAKARVIPYKTALRAPPLKAPTAESVLKVLSLPRARPESPATTVATATTMTLVWPIHARHVVPGPRWSLVVIALGNPHATRSHRLHEMAVPAERPADVVSPALAFEIVGTRWQSSRIRRADSRISFTAQWLPSPVPPISPPPQFAPRFLQTSPVPAPRLWQPRRPPTRLLTRPQPPPPSQPRANHPLNNPLPGRRMVVIPVRAATLPSALRQRLLQQTVQAPPRSGHVGGHKIRMAHPPRSPCHHRRRPRRHHQQLPPPRPSHRTQEQIWRGTSLPQPI